MQNFNEDEKNRIIEMAWQDRTPFDAIENLYGLSQNQVVKFMRKYMKKSSFIMWRKRMHARDTKHAKKVNYKLGRFRGPW